VLIVPILVEPTVPNVLSMSAGFGLALAFTLKDYGTRSYVWVASEEPIFKTSGCIRTCGQHTSRK